MTKNELIEALKLIRKEESLSYLNGIIFTAFDRQRQLFESGSAVHFAYHRPMSQVYELAIAVRAGSPEDVANVFASVVNSEEIITPMVELLRDAPVIVPNCLICGELIKFENAVTHHDGYRHDTCAPKP